MSTDKPCPSPSHERMGHTKPAQPPHECPFSEEMNGGPTGDLCECCEECEHECAMDI